MRRSFFIALVALCGIASSSLTTGCDSAPSGPALLPEVDSFLKNTKSFATVESVEAEPDWASGPRQRVNFSDGSSYLFYIKAGKVETVWKDNPSGGRDVAWGETEK